MEETTLNENPVTMIATVPRFKGLVRGFAALECMFWVAWAWEPAKVRAGDCANQPPWSRRVIYSVFASSAVGLEAGTPPSACESEVSGDCLVTPLVFSKGADSSALLSFMAIPSFVSATEIRNQLDAFYLV